MTCVAAGLAAEAASEIFFKKRIRLYDGSTVFSSLLLALLMPLAIPFWMAGLGSFWAAVIGREVFGGLGQNPFLSALVGRAFLQISFPSSLIKQSMMLENGRWAFAAAAAGIVFLFWQKLIFTGPSFFYLAALFLFSLPLDRNLWPVLFGAGGLFSAFFLLTDPAQAPVSALGRRIFAVTAGMMVFVFAKAGLSSASFVFGILTVAVMSPWTDRLVREKHL